MCVAAKNDPLVVGKPTTIAVPVQNTMHGPVCKTPRKRKIPVRLRVHRNHHNERCSPVHCSGAVNPYLHFSDRDLLLHRKPDFFELFEVHWQYFLSTPSKCFHFLRAVRPTSDVFSLVSPNRFWKNPLPPMFSPSSIHCSASFPSTKKSMQLLLSTFGRKNTC